MVSGDRSPVVFLMGPTAAGKTELAVELVARFPLEIISVDSAMVYRGMDIGTGKPSAAVRERAPHRLIDICEPDDPYSAARFRVDALQAIAAVRRAARVPLLVGGTGLYFKALERGLSALPPADAAIRARLQERAAACGWESLHAELARVDPVAASRIHPHDPQRIQRALEIYACSGIAMTELMARGQASPLRGQTFTIALQPSERATLHARIERRYRTMLDDGLVDEVAALRERPTVTRGLPSMRAVGYRQAWDYLEGQSDWDTMVGQAVTATRQLAKRQLTWLRSQTDADTLECFAPSLLDQACRRMADVL